MFVIVKFKATWWLIPLSKWVIIPIISGLTLLIPFITGVITHLLSGMSHQVHTLLKVTLQQFSTILAFLLARNLRLERKKSLIPARYVLLHYATLPKKSWYPVTPKQLGFAGMFLFDDHPGQIWYRSYCTPAPFLLSASRCLRR